MSCEVGDGRRYREKWWRLEVIGKEEWAEERGLGW